MRTVIVRDAMRITLGKQGENNAVRVVWAGVVDKYAKLYGEGHFELVVVQRGQAYPAVVNVDGADLVWDVRAADTATAEVGSLELVYYAGDTIVKSKTWETVVVASKSADGMTEPPEDPARAWFDAIKRQIGDLSKLTTKAKENLVAAINEAATTGSGGGSVEMRVDGGYIQYSADGVTWENLISVASLEGKPGKDGAPGAPGAPGKDGEPGKDGHTPKIAATKTGKTTSITADGVEIAQIKDGEDAAADISLGITGATVGQIAKITAVDTDGKPTEWEAADVAGGSNDYEFVQSFKLSPDTAVYELADVSKYRSIRVNVVRGTPNNNLGTGNLFAQIAIKDNTAKFFNISIAVDIFKKSFYFCEMSCGKEYSVASSIEGGNNSLILNAGIGFGSFPGFTPNYDEVIANFERCCYRLWYAKPTECIDGNETVYVYGVRR